MGVFIMYRQTVENSDDSSIILLLDMDIVHMFSSSRRNQS